MNHVCTDEQQGNAMTGGAHPSATPLGAHPSSPTNRSKKPCATMSRLSHQPSSCIARTKAEAITSASRSFFRLLTSAPPVARGRP